MFAGARKIDITPAVPVWMDGMLRAHQSQGVHDPLFARCLVLANGPDPAGAVAIIAVDVCALGADLCATMRAASAASSGLGAGHIIIAATHTHSGPATYGFFNPREDEYNQWLSGRIAQLVAEASRDLQQAEISCTRGREESISRYRRLLADDGHVVMNWEPFPSERLVGPLGVADTDVGVLKITPLCKPHDVLALLFNFAGHPNVMSGDNYLLSPDFPGMAAQLLEERFGGVAIFVNGAQGSVDIDGLRDRDWEGVERLGSALAQAVAATASTMAQIGDLGVCTDRIAYDLPSRKITPREWLWAQDVLARTGGEVAALADGVGDDYLAVLYKSLRESEGTDLHVEQVCIAAGDCAFITFPGELYTEIGMAIKAQSPFKQTYVIGLANGYIGYVPTRKAIAEGGYSEDTRLVDASAEEITRRQSLALLRSVYDSMFAKGEQNVKH